VAALVSTLTRRRVLPRLRLPGPRGRRWLVRLLAAVLVLAALLAGAFFWVRQSSLVAVQRASAALGHDRGL
jgi:hypothetical protein